MNFTGNAKGTVFEGMAGNTRISVHRIIHYDGWYLSCPSLGHKATRLKSNTLMEAVEESKQILKHTVEDFSKDITFFCEAEIEISRR